MSREYLEHLQALSTEMLRLKGMYIWFCSWKTKKNKNKTYKVLYYL